MIDDRGGLHQASSFVSALPAVDRSRQSPNHGSRGEAHRTPALIVLHYTGMLDGPSAVDWLCNPLSQVSCHYVVEEDGGLLQLVAEDRRAWHAGRSAWADLTDLNAASIGIEIVNGGHDFGLPAFPDRQIGAVIALCRDIMGRHRIHPEGVLAHSDIAPSRKRDPGERFPWKRLAEAGIGRWLDAVPDLPGTTLEPESAGPDVAVFQQHLARFGYGVAATGTYDTGTETVVRAFQRRFRPARIDGLADPSTRDLLTRLNETVSSAPDRA